MLTVKLFNVFKSFTSTEKFLIETERNNNQNYNFSFLQISSILFSFQQKSINSSECQVNKRVPTHFRQEICFHKKILTAQRKSRDQCNEISSIPVFSNLLFCKGGNCICLKILVIKLLCWQRLHSHYIGNVMIL